MVSLKMEIPKQFEHLKDKIINATNISFFKDKDFIFDEKKPMRGHIMILLNNNDIIGFVCRCMTRNRDISNKDIYLGLITFFISSSQRIWCEVNINQYPYTDHINGHLHIKEYVKKFIPIELFEQLLDNTNELLEI